MMMLIAYEKFLYLIKVYHPQAVISLACHDLLAIAGGVADGLAIAGVEASSCWDRFLRTLLAGFISRGVLL